MIQAIILIIQKTGLIIIPLFLTGLVGWIISLKLLLFVVNEKRHHVKVQAFNKVLNSEISEKELIQNNKHSLSLLFIHSLLKHKEKSKKQINFISQEIINNYILRKYKALSSVKILSAIAPLLGLLGTVNGMIETFKIISFYGNSNPVLMADGISEALLTTQAGLSIAFPLLFMQVFLRNRLKTIKNRLEKYRQEFLNSL